MKVRLTLTVLAAAIFFAGCGEQPVSNMQIASLQCEYRTNPLGIGERIPRLSWMLESDARGSRQTAYRILVASSPEALDRNRGDLWDSGKVESAETANIPYGGAPLESRKECWWKVRSWDENGATTAFSEPAYWSMGLLEPDDWKASWISMPGREVVAEYPEDGKKPPGPPPPWFRKQFSIGGDVEKARVHVSAKGVYELYINGSRVGDDVFSPGWTDYTSRIRYRTYDVTPLLESGENVIGGIVGDGWYAGYVAWRDDRGLYGLDNSLLVQLEVTDTDGETYTVTTNDSWTCATGPILAADFLMGEQYDARKEMPGWSTPGFDDSSWHKPATAPVTGNMTVFINEPVRITGNISPVSMNEPVDRVYVFDLGQNFSGLARLVIEGDATDAGKKITMRFAEMLNPDGTIYTENLRSARATDTYIMNGSGYEVFEPRFTFHGFRYVEVTGCPRPPAPESLTGHVVHSDTPPAGTFACSNDMVNTLWHNIYWGQRSNFLSVPTDCPQRDERAGWMGDAQIFVRTAAYNMDVDAFFTKWMTDVTDAQSDAGSFTNVSPRIGGKPGGNFTAAPAWGDAGIIVPWTIHLMYGDTRIVDRHWESMTAWMDLLLKANPDHIRQNRLGNNYGDWLSINADTPKDLIATAYWAYDAQLMADMAEALGRNAEAGRYRTLYETIRTAFQEAYINDEGRIYPLGGVTGERTGTIPVGHSFVAGRGETQTGYLLALHHDLVPSSLRERAAANLVELIRQNEWHLSTGFLGVRLLAPVLTDTGHTDIAYRLLLNDTFPSWGYSIKHGATTIWERWDGWTAEKGFQDPGMNSFNHYSLGSVGEWLYGYMAGIRPVLETPGFAAFVVKPYPGGGLTHAKAGYRSPRGEIRSGWERDGSTLRLHVTIPANTTATVYVPSDEGAAVSEGGVPADEVAGVDDRGREGEFRVFSVPAGTYRFTTRYSADR